MQLQKSPQQSLTSCYSILDGEDESNTKDGVEEGSPTGVTLCGCTFLAGRDGKEEETAGGAGGCREIARIPPTLALTRLVAAVGPSKSSKEASHIRPTIGDRPQQRFFKEGLKRPLRYWLGMVAFHEIHQYQKRTELLIH